MKGLTHGEIRELIERYHSHATELYKNRGITISPIKNVQLAEDGAFVEAIIFISKDELNLKEN